MNDLEMTDLETLEGFMSNFLSGYFHCHSEYHKDSDRLVVFLSDKSFSEIPSKDGSVSIMISNHSDGRDSYLVGFVINNISSYDVFIAHGSNFFDVFQNLIEKNMSIVPDILKLISMHADLKVETTYKLYIGLR